MLEDTQKNQCPSTRVLFNRTSGEREHVCDGHCSGPTQPGPLVPVTL